MARTGVKVAILASGEGTNAERLIRAAEAREDVDIALVGCNRAAAGVLRRAEALGATTWVFSRVELDSGAVLERLRAEGIGFVALVGFLLKVPPGLVRAFEGRMLNLHPSLLPAFGGKGMYGHHVHKAVHAALLQGEVDRTGITLHWVTEEFDEGAPFFQAEVELDAATDTPESIGDKVRQLEVEHYADQALRAVVEAVSLSGTPLD